MRAVIVTCGMSWTIGVVARPVAADVLDRVLAVVNGAVITQSDAQAALAFGLGPAPPQGADPLRSTLDALINRELILIEVTRYAPSDVDAAAVDDHLRAIRSRFPSDAEYRAALARTAMTADRLRDIVSDEIRIAEYMQERFGAGPEPTDQEIADRYAAHRAAYTAKGQPLTLEEARPRVRQELMDERRTQAINEWVARLRRRAEVTDLYFAETARRSPGGDRTGARQSAMRTATHGIHQS